MHPILVSTSSWLRVNSQHKKVFHKSLHSPTSLFFVVDTYNIYVHSAEKSTLMKNFLNRKSIWRGRDVQRKCILHLPKGEEEAVPEDSKVSWDFSYTKDVMHTIKFPYQRFHYGSLICLLGVGLYSTVCVAVVITPAASKQQSRSMSFRYDISA